MTNNAIRSGLWSLTFDRWGSWGWKRLIICSRSHDSEIVGLRSEASNKHSRGYPSPSHHLAPSCPASLGTLCSFRVPSGLVALFLEVTTHMFAGHAIFAQLANSQSSEFSLWHLHREVLLDYSYLTLPNSHSLYKPCICLVYLYSAYFLVQTWPRHRRLAHRGLY